MGDRSPSRQFGNIGVVGDHTLWRGVEIENGESAASKSPRTFDPARDGFGFKNPVGISPARVGKSLLHRRLDPLLYGNGLCFGMAVAALREFSVRGFSGESGEGISSLRLSDDLLGSLLSLHALQYRPRAILAVVLDWSRSRGGRVHGVLDRLRLPESGNPRCDPHILCFGPAANRRLLHCLRRAHAVVPCRIERSPDETRVYIYDPNYPKRRNRYIVFESDGGFRYGGFSTEEGWGISLIPLSALGEISAASISSLSGEPAGQPR